MTAELEEVAAAAEARGWECVGDLATPALRRTMSFHMLDDRRRFALTCVCLDNGCWEWVGSTKAHGYGQFHYHGGNAQAHRVSYELHIGRIPDGMTVDHLCHNADDTCPGGASCPHRRCVNPAHLAPIPGPDNYRRGHARRPRCKNGHPVTPETTGPRGCTICETRNVTVQSDRAVVALLGAGRAKARAKVSDDDIVLMRAMRADGDRLAEIARRFGLTAKYASALIAGSRTRKRSHTGPTPAVRRTVKRRSAGQCELVACGLRADHVHHRRPRRMGGSMAVDSNLPGNLVHLCSGHHDWVESNRTAATSFGLLLGAGEVPAAVPLRLCHGFVLLLDDGDLEEVDPARYADRITDPGAVVTRSAA